MSQLCVALHLLSACVLVAQAYNTYVVQSPNSVRPGQTFPVSVAILKAPQAVLVKATIRRSVTTVTSSSANFKSDQPGQLSLKIPEDASSGSYYLDVEGSGGLSFKNSSSITFKPKGFSIFVQTDKGIYKPSQTVRFRIFGVKSDLVAVKGSIDVLIKDPNGNRVRQLLQQQATSGVVESSLQLSDQPVLGDWKISVSYQNQKTDTVFQVDEYVLPKFEVKVNLPPFILDRDNILSGSVEAKYTFGKGVAGTVKVRVLVDPWYSWQKKERPSLERTFKMDEKMDFQFTLSEIKQLNNYLTGKSVVVEANVTEALTGKTLSGKSQVKVYNQRAKLVFPKVNPTTFKPGLRFSAVIQLQQQDGSPVPAKFGRQVTVRRTYKWEKQDPTPSPYPKGFTGTTTPTTTTPWWGGWKPIEYETRVLPELLLTADDAGSVLLDWQPSAEAEEMILQFTYMENGRQINLYKTIKRMHSPRNSYLQLSISEPSLSAGSIASLNLKSTSAMNTVFYQVMARGSLVHGGSFSASGKMQAVLKLPVSADMAPSARFVVYYVTQEGEVVNDALNVNVDGAFKNKVSLALSENQAEPGQAVNLSVLAEPGSFIALSAVDQSSLLLASANDITQQSIMNELQQYDTASTPSFTWRGPMPIGRRRSLWYPWYPTSVNGEDATGVFQQSGLVTFTDAWVFKYVKKQVLPVRPWFNRVDAVKQLAGGAFPERIVLPGVQPTSSPTEIKLKEPTKTRKTFPETWLWTSTDTSTGAMNISSQVPDSITSWVASAFALHPTSGLGVVDAPSTLRVFRPFFISLNLPYSVVRGEQVVVQATVFNYLSKDLPVMVTLGPSPNFEVAEKKNGKIVGVSNRVALFSLYVPAGKAASTYFPITALKPGFVTLRVKAQSTLAADAVERQLLVEPEGAEQEYTESFLLSLKAGEKFSEKVPISFPPRVVSGSERVTVTAIGDLMGPASNNLDKLLKMPYGCGEQNMLNFAPNIYVSSYLKAVGQYTKAIEEKAVRFMEQGYQRELTYQRKDYSFSAFGNRDKSGSMWLTAFVVKSFEEAKPFIFIDQEVIDSAVSWMIKQQLPDGSFPEPGRVIHKDMQGGSASKDTLTAYVLLTLLQVKDDLSPTLKVRVEPAIRSAEALVSQVANTAAADVYFRSIAHLALTRAQHSSAATLRSSLETSAIVSGGEKHWEKPEKPKTSKHWQARHVSPKAINVEMTAYNLMALQEANGVTSAIPVMRWMVKQMNSRGGFVSTQDTVVGLRALSGFARSVQGAAGAMTVSLNAGSEQHSFSVSKANSLVLQSYSTRNVPSELQLSATGPGFALVQVNVQYNVLEVPLESSFMLNTTLLKETKEELLMQVCVRYPGEESGMAVVEHGLLTGFELDPESVGSPRGLKRTEFEERKAIFYFDQFDDREICYKASLLRTDLVAKSQPAIIRVYDYYNPDKQTTASYESALLKATDACDVCTDCRQLCG